MSKYKTLAAASLALVLLAACGSSGLGDILGGGGGNSPSNNNYQIRGVVDSVDTNGRSVYLRNVSGLTSMLSNSGSGNTARVYFDENTTVDYQGQTYRPENLERGDEVTVNVDQSGNQLIAERISVTYNAGGNNSNSSTYPSSGSGNYTSTVRGTVRSVDTSRRTIQLESTSWLNNNYNGNTSNGSTITVYYDANAGIDVNGSLQAISGLERGDVIEVQLRNSGSTYVADRLYLVRDVNR